MRRFRWLLIVLFVVAASVLAWACSGGKEKEPGAATTPAVTSSAEKTPEAGKTPEVGRTPEVDNTPEAGVTPEDRGDVGKFGELARKFAESTFKATYQMASTGGEQGLEGTLTWYKKGDDLRMDIESEVEGQKVSGVFIDHAGQSYFCMASPGLGESGTCLQTPGGSGQGVQDIIGGLEETLTNPQVEIVSTETRNVAGEKVDCFVVRSPDSEGESEVCVSADGVPLFTKATAGGEEMTMEATNFSHDVSDSDFELPYPVSEGLPGAPSGQ